MNLLEKSSLMSKFLHLIDCGMIVLFLWLLCGFFDVRWSIHYSRLALAVFVISYASFYSFQLYTSWRGRKLYKELIVIIKAWGVTVGAVLFLFFVFKSSVFYSRGVILSWFVLSPLVVFGMHLAIREVLGILRSRGKNLKKAVIVGANDLGAILADHIENMPWAGIQVAGFFDNSIDNGEKFHRKPILGKSDDLPDYVKANKVDVVYIALPVSSDSLITSVVASTRASGASMHLVADLFTYGLANTEKQYLGDMLLFSFNPGMRHKRYFDVVFSSLAILATLPLTLLIALLVKIEDKGPIFYGHRRITISGKEFKCLKFRTMYVGADKRLAEILKSNPEAREEWEKTFKLKNDPRITRIGRFLRKTSLDELPQFINVIKGEMSVVGARPVVSAELSNYYKEYAGLYCSMKPGITGPWQIGKRSDTEDYDERVSLDMWYVRNHSMWLDLKIILKTCLCMLKGRGAY